MSDLNPYASPRAEQQSPAVPPSREKAQSIVRRTLLILAVCVGINIWANFYWADSQLYNQFAAGPVPPIVIFNVIFFAIVFVVLWLVALRVLEWMGRIFHRLFGGNISLNDWMTSLHHSIWPMVPATLIGAVLWVTWLILFHLADRPGGFALDVAFQFAGHMLGAWVYLNVFWNWYQLRRAAQPIPVN